MNVTMGIEGIEERRYYCTSNVLDFLRNPLVILLSL